MNVLHVAITIYDQTNLSSVHLSCSSSIPCRLYISSFSYGRVQFIRPPFRSAKLGEIASNVSLKKGINTSLLNVVSELMDFQIFHFM